MPLLTVEQLAEALLALVHAEAGDRERQADTLALQLVWALTGGERATAHLTREERQAVLRAIRAYEAVRGV